MVGKTTTIGGHTWIFIDNRLGYNLEMYGIDLYVSSIDFGAKKPKWDWLAQKDGIDIGGNNNYPNRLMAINAAIKFANTYHTRHKE